MVIYLPLNEVKFKFQVKEISNFLVELVFALFTTSFSRQTPQIFRNRPFATNDHMVRGGGQAHYYSRTGTLKQRDLNQ